MAKKIDDYRNLPDFERKELPTFIKSYDEDQGLVTHFIAIIGNKDSVGDRIMPNAFKKTILERKDRIKVLDQHSTDSVTRIVGKPVDLREVGRDELTPEVLKYAPDATGGLLATTQYAIKTSRGRDVFNLVKEGFAPESSIGYDPVQTEHIKEKGEDGEEEDVRLLKQIRLWEYSNVIFGCNNATAVISAKSDNPSESKPAPDVTENTIRIRVRDPGDFEDDSFRTITIGPKDQGIQAVVGRLDGETTMTIQAYIFDKDKFSVAEAQAWVNEHKKDGVPDIDEKQDDEEAPQTFECVECGYKLTADEMPEECPECGGEMRPVKAGGESVEVKHGAGGGAAGYRGGRPKWRKDLARRLACETIQQNTSTHHRYHQLYGKMTGEDLHAMPEKSADEEMELKVLPVDKWEDSKPTPMEPVDVKEAHWITAAVLEKQMNQVDKEFDHPSAPDWAKELVPGKVATTSPLPVPDDLRVTASRDIDAETKGASGNLNLPIAPRDRLFDGAAAVKRVRDWAGVTDKANEKYRQAYFWYDAQNPENLGSYKLAFADVIDGRLHAIPRGIFVTAALLQGSRGGVDIPASDKNGVKSRVSRYYARMREEFDDDSITPPWEKAAVPEAVVFASVVLQDTLTKLDADTWEYKAAELALSKLRGLYGDEVDVIELETKAGRVLAARNAQRIGQALAALISVLEDAGIDIPGLGKKPEPEMEEEEEPKDYSLEIETLEAELGLIELE